MTAIPSIIKSKVYKKLPTHVKEILNYIKTLNLEDVTLEHNCHYKITWLANGKRCGISFSGTPKNDAHMLNIVKRDIRREMSRRVV